jgi:nucleoside-diphosphate-sugar epimerase
MKILIIGNGFLATSIVERLESEGHEVLVFSRTLSARIQCQQFLGDIFDFEDFIKVLDWKPQVIIHTAWITTPGVYRDDSSNIRYAKFTANLAKYVANSDLEHLIALGTCAEYGYQSGPSTAGITTPAPISLYAQQKDMAFNSVKEILQESNVRFTWARVFYTYGPNQDQNRLIPRLIHSLNSGEPIILTDTSSIYDWITRRDIASAISWTLANELPTEIDVGTTFGFTNLELLITLEKLLHRTNQLPAQDSHKYGLNEVLVAGNNSPLFTSGWFPRDTLSTGLEWVLGR